MDMSGGSGMRSGTEHRLAPGYLLITVSCLCILPGFHAEECSQMVLARRDTVYVPEGGSLSLSCVVQHCGDNMWTGAWVWRKASENKLNDFKPNLRHSLSNVALSSNQTRLFLNFLRANQSDEGSYGCKVTWGQGLNDLGHMVYVNITAAAVPSERSMLHRVLVCVGASLCFPVVLGLARCLRSEVKPRPLPRTLSINRRQPGASYRVRPCLPPQPPPRRPVPQHHTPSTHTATPKSKPNKELVYAALSQDTLGQRADREPVQATVYSSLRFT